jgi:hypothetical protein
LNKTLVNFEKQIGLGSTYAARLLGVAYQTYASYKNERRKLPLYHARHIRCMLLLPKDVLQKEIEDFANGNHKTNRKP